MSDTEQHTEKELGEASKLTMDEFIRTLVGQMFENDNDTAKLEVELEGTNANKPPKIEVEMRLVSINGVKTREDEESV